MPMLRIGAGSRMAVLLIGLVALASGCGGGVPPTGTVVEEDLHPDDQERPAMQPGPKPKSTRK